MLSEDKNFQPDKSDVFGALLALTGACYEFFI
jgi:hypothetical protein